VTAVPLAARIHEGLIDVCAELRRTLLDRLVELFCQVAREIPRRVVLVADAFYASANVILPLLGQGHTS
jgi:hypothetical protein